MDLNASGHPLKTLKSGKRNAYTVSQYVGKPVYPIEIRIVGREQTKEPVR